MPIPNPTRSLSLAFTAGFQQDALRAAGIPDLPTSTTVVERKGGRNSNSPEKKLIYPKELGNDPKYMHYISFYIYEIDSTKLIDNDNNLKLASVGSLEDQLGDSGGAVIAAAVGGAAGVAGFENLLSRILGGIGVAKGAGGVVAGLNNTALFNVKYGSSVNAQSEISISRQQLGLGDNYEKIPITIHLPMPNTIETNYGFEYSDVDMALTKSAIDLTNVTLKRQTDPQALQALAAQVNLSNIGTGDVVVNAANDFAKVVGVGVSEQESAFQELSMMKSGQIKAPFTEKLFKNVTRRSFDLKYKLSPRSFEEAMTIYELIRVFKVYSHPAPSTVVADDGREFASSFYLKTPAEFSAKFMYDQYENYFLPKYGRLVLKSIDVTYGSSDSKGFASFRPTRVVESTTNVAGVAGTQKMQYGSFPSEIEMSLKFEEMELLTRTRIEQGW